MKKALFALVGHQIQYSLSPKVFHHPLLQELYPVDFKLIEIKDKLEWQNFWKTEAPKFTSVAVTTPWKNHLSKLNLESKSLEVQFSKTGNWIDIIQDKYHAHNSDFLAFENWWADLPKTPEKIIYLSTGASSKTFFAMLKKKIKKPNINPTLYMVSSSKTEISAQDYFDLEINLIDYPTLFKMNFGSNALLINGTPLGQKKPLNMELIKIMELCMVWDLNYAIEYPYYSFYQKKGLDFLVRQAINFLQSTGKINHNSLEDLISKIVSDLS